jgi:hypothetical protein
VAVRFAILGVAPPVRADFALVARAPSSEERANDPRGRRTAAL